MPERARRDRLATKKHKHHTTKTCNGKVRFRDKAEADKAMQRLKINPRQRAVQRAYECDRCKGWHLTGMYRPPQVRGLPDEFVHALDDTLPVSHPGYTPD